MTIVAAAAAAASARAELAGALKQLAAAISKAPLPQAAPSTRAAPLAVCDREHIIRRGLAASMDSLTQVEAGMAPLQRLHATRMLRAVAAIIEQDGAAVQRDDGESSDDVGDAADVVVPASTAAVAHGTSGVAGVPASAGAATDAASCFIEAAASVAAHASHPQPGALTDAAEGRELVMQVSDAVLYPSREALLAMDLEGFARDSSGDAAERERALQMVAAFRAL